MRLKLFSVLLFLLFVGQPLYSQTCSVLGQNPSTAFPVCGTNTFSQSTVPYCGGRALPGPCSTDGIGDTNPFWYKFTCFSAGTLAFVLTPNDLADDYDWELFDITGHNPADVYTNISLFVACNWSGNTGLTGASAAGRSLQNCAGETYPTFSAMPALKVGHNYLLLISHFTKYTPSQNGYKLSFGGGSASITDTLLPNIVNAAASCDATQITVRLNKKMKCSSLDANGSDFNITPAIATITGATSADCTNGFDMDSVTLTLSKPLPPGNYTIAATNGDDGNSLLDICDRNIPPGNKIPLVIYALAPTPMDSLTKVGCSPQLLQLVFRKKISCSSIASDGSDFIVTGPTAVIVTGASGNCVNEKTDIINVTLAGKILTSGNYQIKLVQGTDGNTLLDACGQQTPAGSTLNFSTKDTVSAEFTYTIYQSCLSDSIAFFHDGGNGVNQWNWNFGYAGKSNLRDPVISFKTFGIKQIALSVSNGTCSDSATKIINLDNALKAAFETNNIICPEDTASFINNSIGNISSYNWDFGNGNTSTEKDPLPLHYPFTTSEKIYNVRLIIKSNAGCFDTAYQNIQVLKSCYIAVPNAFTPNSDGLNDYLYPLNAFKADDLEFRVYNRVGECVFTTTDWKKKWDGTFKGNPQDAGVYVWILKYVNRDTGKKIFQKGSAVLIR